MQTDYHNDSHNCLRLNPALSQVYPVMVPFPVYLKSTLVSSTLLHLESSIILSYQNVYVFFFSQ